MPFHFVWTALVTMISVFIYAWMGMRVARARMTYDIKVPATTGNPDFERIFRVQANTGEQLLQFLPGLWLFAIWFGDLWAAAIGVFWPIGRIIYAIGYSKAAEKRGPGAMITMLANAILAIGAVVGIVLRFVHLPV